MTINLNEKKDYGVRDVSIFNNGKSGIVDGVDIRIEKKKPGEPVINPDYRLIAKDGLGEVNEGFWYQKDIDTFKKFQAQRLIRLGKGVFGENFEFPLFDTPTQALDGVLKAVANATKNKGCRVAVCYGTTKRPQRYLRFKSFGRFLELMNEFPTTQMSFDKGDNLTRPEVTPTEESTLLTGTSQIDSSDDSDWMK